MALKTTDYIVTSFEDDLKELLHYSDSDLEKLEKKNIRLKRLEDKKNNIHHESTIKKKFANEHRVKTKYTLALTISDIAKRSNGQCNFKKEFMTPYIDPLTKDVDLYLLDEARMDINDEPLDKNEREFFESILLGKTFRDAKENGCIRIAIAIKSQLLEEGISKLTGESYLKKDLTLLVKDLVKRKEEDLTNFKKIDIKDMKKYVGRTVSKAKGTYLSALRTIE